jgi:hypothetical protein
LDVVHAMAPEILAEMTVAINGHRLLFSEYPSRYPVHLCSEFPAGPPEVCGRWEIVFEFPRLISPSVHGSDDRRELAIRLRTVRFARLS